MALPNLFKKARAGDTTNERLVGKITADLVPLQARLAEIEHELLDDDLVLQAYLGEPVALERQSILRTEQASQTAKIAEASRALEVVRSIVQRETAQRIAAKNKAAIETHCGTRQTQVAAAREFQDLLVKLEATRNRIFDIGEELVNSHATIAGSFPGPGLMTAAGELTKLISHEFFRVSHAEFFGGNPLAKAPRPSLPGSKAPDGVTGAVPNKEQRDAGMPIQKWMPTITETLEQVAVWERNILEGRARYDGRSVDTPTDEAPAEPALWAVPGPQAPASAPEPHRASPHIAGLPAASSDDGLADILGSAPPPAPVAVPKSKGGSFFDPTTKTWVQSSVSGDPYTPEQIAAMQIEAHRKAPKGFPPPAPKRRLD